MALKSCHITWCRRARRILKGDISIKKEVTTNVVIFFGSRVPKTRIQERLKQRLIQISDQKFSVLIQFKVVARAIGGSTSTRSSCEEKEILRHEGAVLCREGIERSCANLNCGKLGIFGTCSVPYPSTTAPSPKTRPPSPERDGGHRIV